MFTLPFGVLLSPLLLGAGRTILGAVGGRIDRLAANGAALSRPFPHHVGQQLMVGGKHRVSEPVAQQRVGNTLYADARLSIIQREAGDEAQMKMVSSVFHNRLKEGSPFPRLESDVTVWYPYYRKDQVPESILPSFKSNYNTYSLEGLPPGPICCPGEAAIDAALNPAESEYFFFVTDVKNNYYYAVTFEEHVKNCKKAAKAGTLGGTAVEE